MILICSALVDLLSKKGSTSESGTRRLCVQHFHKVFSWENKTTQGISHRFEIDISHGLVTGRLVTGLKEKLTKSLILGKKLYFYV